jgi:hypothetical protein
MNLKKATMLAAMVGASLGTASLAKAQDTVIQTESGGPNRVLMQSGIVVLGLSYVPAFVVATTSPRSEDNYLYIPVAGPWLDLGHREGCNHPNGNTCDNETMNKALLVTDGVFQGIGALQILGSFLFPETTVVRSRAAAKPRTVTSSLKIRPASFGSGYGVMATSQF